MNRYDKNINYRNPSDVEHNLILKLYENNKNTLNKISICFFFSVIIFSFFLLLKEINSGIPVVMIFSMVIILLLLFSITIYGVKKSKKRLAEIEKYEYGVIDCFPVDCKTSSGETSDVYYLKVQTIYGQEINHWFKVERATYKKYKNGIEMQLLLIKRNNGENKLIDKLEYLTK